VGKRRLSKDEIKIMNSFESMTGAKVKDCIDSEEILGIVVNKGDMGLAIGKKGVKIEKVRKAYGKTIWVIEYAEDQDKFVKNIFHPVTIHNIRVNEEQGQNYMIIEVSRRDRGKVLGPEGRKLKMAKRIVKRHLSMDDLNVKTV